MWYYHRDLFTSLAFLATPYSPVGPTMLNVSAVNAQTEAALGYPIFGYWTFLNQSDAASIIDAHASPTLASGAPDSTYMDLQS